MTTQSRYVSSPGDMAWSMSMPQQTTFCWEYDDGRAELLALYDKGKRQQWNAGERIDWSRELDTENPMQLPDETITLFGSDIWDRLAPKEVVAFRRHAQAWQISQFLHGEQGALICAAKIVQQVQNIDAKFYAATQVIDEARTSRPIRVSSMTSSTWSPAPRISDERAMSVSTNRRSARASVSAGVVRRRAARRLDGTRHDGSGRARSMQDASRARRRIAHRRTMSYPPSNP